jgi:hypothetical protein
MNKVILMGRMVADPETGYTAELPLNREITYILDKQPFVPEGYVCMSIK